MLKHLLLFLVAILSCFVSIGQDQSSDEAQVTINGSVFYSGSDEPGFNLLIVNKRTAQGTFGNRDGSFSVKALKSDTLLVGALGFKTSVMTMADSMSKSSYTVRIFLQRVSYNLNEFEVFPKRELDSIQQDIKQLGYDEKDYMLSGIDAYVSPITFLYQQFSRKAIRERQAYEQMNEDSRRDLLKELFAKYVDYEIIDLDRREFDDFIDFMAVTDRELRQLSQYDFIMYTKRKFQQFRNSPPRLRQDIDTHD